MRHQFSRRCPILSRHPWCKTDRSPATNIFGVEPPGSAVNWSCSWITLKWDLEAMGSDMGQSGASILMPKAEVGVTQTHRCKEKNVAVCGLLFLRFTMQKEENILTNWYKIMFVIELWCAKLTKMVKMVYVIPSHNGSSCFAFSMNSFQTWSHHWSDFLGVFSSWLTSRSMCPPKVQK